jgi:hypothetical protein
VVDSTTVPHTIRLERGRIDAEVNPDRPGQPLEAFAVIAGQTRVAVRGTVFSVTRHAARVSVAVTRGKVAVSGLQADSPTELLESPSEADFDLGGRLASAQEPTETPQSKVTSPTRPTPAKQQKETDPAEPAVTALSMAQARARVTGCLEAALAQTQSGDAVVTISSQVTVVTSGSGDVTAVRFNPPLRPDLQQTCGGLLFGSKIEPAGTASFAVNLSSAR